MIVTVDNPFGSAFHETLYDYVINSYFKIGSQDGPSPLDRRNHVYIHSDYSIDDVNRIGLLDKLKQVPEFSLYKDLRLLRTTINCSVPSDTNFIHTHDNQISLVYYVNLDWKPEWAGETVFFDHEDEIVTAVLPKFGRLVVFPSAMLHAARSVSRICSQLRVVFVLKVSIE